nr:MAG TPA: hypothetical protein [Caudoviricetes sp.]
MTVIKQTPRRPFSGHIFPPWQVPKRANLWACQSR